MTFRALIVLAFLLCAGPSKSQFYFYDNEYFDKPIMFELGGSFAFFNCLTDLGGKKGIGKRFIKDLNLKNTQIGGSAYLTATYMNAVALRLEGSYGQIKAYDSILKPVAPTTFGRYERNLSFRSTILEGCLLIELHPLFIFRKFGSDEPVPRISPYIVGGIGYFHFDPEAKLYNTYLRLQPLSLEGQGFSEYPDVPVYKLNQVNFPVGAGIKYDLSRSFSMRMELLYRILKTDYLDDAHSFDFVDPLVFANYLTGPRLANAILLYDRRRELNPSSSTLGQQRANPKDNDAYFTLNIKMGLTFGREKSR